jgi:hypothetical protein
MAKRQADGQRTKDESSDEEEVDVSELPSVVMARCGRVTDGHSLETVTSLSHPSQEDRECGFKSDLA